MKKILAIILIIFLVSCVKNSDKNFDRIAIDNGKKIIKLNVEIADDNNKRMNGLMFREKLDENAGMLFVFEDENYHTFWMKNTLIPLDMIFIEKNFKIINIEHAVPCNQEPCVLYKSSRPAEYVLEANGNFTTKNGIKAGDRIYGIK